MPWRDRLKRMLRQQEQRAGTGGARKGPAKEDVLRFLAEVVAPALNAVAGELADHGRDAEVDSSPEQVSITVFDGEEEEFFYAVRARTFRKATFAFPELTFKDEQEDAYHRAVVYTREGSQDYGIMGYDRDQVIANFMHEYDKQLRWQKPARRPD